MNVTQTQGYSRDRRQDVKWAQEQVGTLPTTKTLMHIKGDRMVRLCSFHGRSKTCIEKFGGETSRKRPFGIPSDRNIVIISVQTASK
jgi:hypothetical protein